MIDASSYDNLKQEILNCIVVNQSLLNQLRDEIRPLKNAGKRIQSRGTTAISLVGTDGGNRNIHYNPFSLQLIRVVDSSNNEYCLSAISPATSIENLSQAQFDPTTGQPTTPLGEMMSFLGVKRLDKLSHMIGMYKSGEAKNPRWPEAYRELVEWAVLFSVLSKKDFGTDTLIVFDGLLRSKVFAFDLFQRYLEGIGEIIKTHFTRSRRKIYLVGLAKHSKLLIRYQLAMTLEQVLTTEYPAYVEIPQAIESKVYKRVAYVAEKNNAEMRKFGGGKLFLVKFGSQPRDPIWPVDIFLPQKSEASVILGYLLADALDGFPVPFYPLCLQKAHENAALVGFDFDILQDQILTAIRQMLGNESQLFDILKMQDTDPARQRYLE